MELKAQSHPAHPIILKILILTNKIRLEPMTFTHKDKDG